MRVSLSVRRANSLLPKLPWIVKLESDLQDKGRLPNLPSLLRQCQNWGRRRNLTQTTLTLKGRSTSSRKARGPALANHEDGPAVAIGQRRPSRLPRGSGGALKLVETLVVVLVLSDWIDARGVVVVVAETRALERTSMAMMTAPSPKMAAATPNMASLLELLATVVPVASAAASGAPASPPPSGLSSLEFFLVSVSCALSPSSASSLLPPPSPWRFSSEDISAQAAS
ncbi:hypothetical protein HPB47_008616 [Ixodes persulcatus]|uniref:Uncharacterized protein n=1 Tax=Ixodes persulcatus TaxID=34615 RepID=A0AC60P447_IXOPE|nr:hypothetical protein HPB47_008616 [Ixodes persulcatus]